jgi:rRNA maturation RNase YbeY
MIGGRCSPVVWQDPMILNQQRCYALPRSVLHVYVQDLKRRLRLARRDFNVCFVDDAAIKNLNATYRHKDRATDVLSFPWDETTGGATRQAGRRAKARRPVGAASLAGGEFKGFLGDIVISAETARRNAQGEGHSTVNEIRWLILHGVLHLLGYDHEHDNGEMTALELAWRERLEIDGGRSRPRGR